MAFAWVENDGRIVFAECLSGQLLPGHRFWFFPLQDRFLVSDDTGFVLGRAGEGGDDPRVASILDACQEWVWQVDEAGAFTFSSDASSSVVGVSPAQLIGRTYVSLLPVREAVSFTALFRSALAEGHSIHRHVHRISRNDGKVGLLDMNGTTLRAADGRVIGYCGVSRLISDDVRADPVFRDPDNYYDVVPVALCLADRHGRFVHVNHAFARLLNMSPDEVQGRMIADFMPEGAANFGRDIEAFDIGHGVPDHEFIWRGRSYQVSVRPVRDADGLTIGGAVSLTDISIYKRAERVLAAANERLQATAERDFLTGLLNRRQFEEIYRIEVSAARREQAPVSLMIIDVDQFKLFNDYYGHPAGDECLRQVARALSTALSRPRDVVCRYGGEEFVAILPSTDPAGAQVVAERVRQAVWNIGRPHVRSTWGQISVSIGVSSLMSIDPTVDMASRRRMLLEAADTALYEAKRRGRNMAWAASSVIHS